MGERLTEAQRRILDNIANGRNPYHGFTNGRAARGGITGPVAILRRKGLVSEAPGISLTDAGRSLLKENPNG